MSLDLAIMINYQEKFLHGPVGLLQNHCDAHDDRQSPAQELGTSFPHVSQKKKKKTSFPHEG